MVNDSSHGCSIGRKFVAVLLVAVLVFTQLGYAETCSW